MGAVECPSRAVLLMQHTEFEKMAKKLIVYPETPTVEKT